MVKSLQECREYRRHYYQEHKEEMLDRGYEYGRKWREKLKRETLTHYANKRLACVICGEIDPSCLTLDHINGNGNRHRLSLGKQGKNFYYWLKRQGYPQGYQTLCMNCQFKKAYQNQENKKGRCH